MFNWKNLCEIKLTDFLPDWSDSDFHCIVSKEGENIQGTDVSQGWRIIGLGGDWAIQKDCGNVDTLQRKDFQTNEPEEDDYSSQDRSS